LMRIGRPRVNLSDSDGSVFTAPPESVSGKVLEELIVSAASRVGVLAPPVDSADIFRVLVLGPQVAAQSVYNDAQGSDALSAAQVAG
jgi:hypothetical protein